MNYPAHRQPIDYTGFERYHFYCTGISPESRHIPREARGETVMLKSGNIDRVNTVPEYRMQSETISFADDENLTDFSVDSITAQ